jgi:hypothetical protein
MTNQVARRFSTLYNIFPKNASGYNAAIMLVSVQQAGNLKHLIRDAMKLDVPVLGAVVDKLGSNDAFSVTLLNGVPFYSPAGRAKNKSVGRWHTAPVKSKTQVGFHSISQGPAFTTAVIPLELEGAKTGAFITLSDNAPHELYEYLDATFPERLKMGLIAARTPFENGLPYTVLSINQRCF